MILIKQSDLKRFCIAQLVSKHTDVIMNDLQSSGSPLRSQVMSASGSADTLHGNRT